MELDFLLCPEAHFFLKFIFLAESLSYSLCSSPYSDRKALYLLKGTKLPSRKSLFLGARTSGEQCVVKALPPSSTCSLSLSPRRSLLKTSPSLRQLSKPDLTNISSTFLGYRVLTLTYRVSQKNREKNPKKKCCGANFFHYCDLGALYHA